MRMGARPAPGSLPPPDPGASSGTKYRSDLQTSPDRVRFVSALTPSKGTLAFGNQVSSAHRTSRASRCPGLPVATLLAESASRADRSPQARQTRSSTFQLPNFLLDERLQKPFTETGHQSSPRRTRPWRAASWRLKVFTHGHCAGLKESKMVAEDKRVPAFPANTLPRPLTPRGGLSRQAALYCSLEKVGPVQSLKETV